MNTEPNDSENLEDVLDSDGEDGAGADSSGVKPPTEPDQKAPEDSKDKRISDLMSKWQSAEAKAAKLEKASKAAEGKGVKDQSALSPEVQQWIELARGQARDQVYASDSRFSDFGLDRNSIVGDSPAELAESAKKMSSLFDQIETKMRESILKKHGLSPELKPSPRDSKAKSFGDMTSEEFEKELAKAKSAW